MTTTTINHFDVLDYVKKSREFGVPEQLAEYQARQIEQSIDIAINTARAEIENKDLASKMDIKELELKLSAEIHKSKIDTVLWVGGIMLTLLVASGLIQHFFK